MKTYKEFISERYYRPDETLSSGRTANINANSSISKKFQSRNNDNETRRRLKSQIDKVRTNVRFDAGEGGHRLNPNLTKDQKKGGWISKNEYYNKDSKDEEQELNMHHRPSGITFNLIRQLSNPKSNKKPTYEVHFDHDRKNLSHQNKIRLGLKAKELFQTDISKKYPNGALIRTAGTSDGKKSTKKRSNPQNIPSKKTDIYKKIGFSSRDAHGNIFGRVKRRRSGTKINPVSPTRGVTRTKFYAPADRDYTSGTRSYRRQAITDPRNFAAELDTNVNKKNWK